MIKDENAEIAIDKLRDRLSAQAVEIAVLTERLRHRATRVEAYGYALATSAVGFVLLLLTR